MQPVTFGSNTHIQTFTSIMHGRNIDPRILIALRYIDANYTRPSLGLESISRSAGLSTWHFSRRFNADMEIGIRDYLRSLRMKHASSLLTVSSLPIKEVASVVGYLYLSDFYRHFKQEYRLSPSVYRKNAHRHGEAMSASADSGQQKFAQLPQQQEVSI